jgi:uncharacterized protein (DUF2252 family)
VAHAATTRPSGPKAKNSNRHANSAYLSVADRVATGKATRAAVPRSSHASLEPPSKRTDPVRLLERQAETRVPELVPIRYGRMLASPFAFYRGAALIMANDLASTPDTGFPVQCCGDAHLSNFGAFASPERRLVFDINDFDETLPGPWEWDVKRLATSILIAARDNGLRPRDQDRAVINTVGQYRKSMRDFAGMRNLDVWYAHLELESEMNARAADFRARRVRQTRAMIEKAHTKDSISAFEKLAHEVDGECRILHRPPLIVPVERFAPYPRQLVLDSLHELVHDYRRSLQVNRRALLEQFEIADFARKVVGVGSVGTRAFIALMIGRDRGDPLFLQAKEAEPSVLEEFVGRSHFRNHGERVVRGQRLMQATPDIFLGWLRNSGPALDGQTRDFYVRQFKDWKGSVEIEQLDGNALVFYGRLCGGTLARAHARSGDRIAIAAYLGNKDTFERAILGFAHAYAEQNERDYARLRTAVESGRITAQMGV